MSITSGRKGIERSLSASQMLLALFMSRTIAALSQQYCSSQNTGSDSSPVSNNFQSWGACQQSCPGYAFAIVQNKSCWCSNYVPGELTSTGSCSAACPGYPYETCGNDSSDLYGYIALGPSPSGTQGSAPSTSAVKPSPTQATQPTVQPVSNPPLPAAFSPTSPPLAPSFLLQPSSSFLGPFAIIPSTPVSFKTLVLTTSVQNSLPEQGPVTVQDTVTDQPSVRISYVSITPTTTSTSTTQQLTLMPIAILSDTTQSSNTPTPTTPTPTTPTLSTATPTTPTATSTTSTSSKWSATPFISVMTITGQVQTLTVTPTAPPATATTIITAKESNGGFWADPGKIAATFTITGLLLLALLGAALWYFFTRRKREHPDQVTLASTLGGTTPQRRPSRLSQMGLIGGGSQGERVVPRLDTSGWGPGNNSVEKSPADTLSADRRNSLPRVVDQRLEPTALWNPLHDNGSHVSVRSFRDDQDYSRRMLRIANPDDD